MTLDWAALLGGDAGWVLVANLPYNVATPLVSTCSTASPAIERMLVMVQREVGERLAAAPGTPAYGAVQVKVAYWADGADRRARAGVGVRAPAEGRVGARRDRPPRAAARPTPTPLFALVRTAFGQRRKMLRRSLAGVVDAGAVRRRRHRPDGPARGARRRRLGAGWPTAVGARDVGRGRGAGQADAVAAHHRASATTATT